MTPVRCGKCGNLIPSWAHGVCQRCAMVARDEERYGKRRRKRSQLPVSRPAPQPRVELTKASERELKQSSSGWRLRLEGFNRLLEDVYGEKIWLGHLLVKQGITQEQVRLWRGDKVWLLGFLERLERKLLSDLTKAVPGQNARVLSYWYGLSTSQKRSVQAIATELGITPLEVDTALNTLLNYLRGQAGRMALEESVLVAARKNRR